jgi:hypothetical protein
VTASTIFDFIDDEELFASRFRGASWSTWKVVLRAAFALPMSEAELEVFAEIAGGRKPPTKPIRELICCVGRGGGKDSVAAALASYIACTANTEHLRRGEFADVLLFATDRQQCGIAFNYVKGFFDDEDLPLLRGMVRERARGPAIDDSTIELTNQTRITVSTNNRRSPRGRTACCAIFDEAAFWYNESYANPDIETDAAVSPGLMRFPGSLKIIISSVNTRSGLLYEKYAKYFGNDDPDTLVVLGESLKFNPTLDENIINAELERDYERAAAEYLCKWRDDLSTFLDRETIEAAVERNCLTRAPQQHTRYFAFADPSSGRGDSFTMAVSHSQDGKCIVDHLYEKTSPFNVETAVSEIVAILKEYKITQVTGDKYAIGFVENAFRKESIRYNTSNTDKSQIYLAALPLFSTGRAVLLDNKRLIFQLSQLERRSSPMGKDSVSHPERRNARDDLANAACGGLVLASARRGPVTITAGMLEWASRPGTGAWGQPTVFAGDGWRH